MPIQISSGFISWVYTRVLNVLQGALPFASAISLLLSLLIFAIIIIVIISAFTLIVGWAERKSIARMQSRRGPTYVGKYGLLQNVADLVKLISKEHIVPDLADKIVFQATLPMLTALTILVLFLIPFTGSFIGISSSIALIVVFVLLSFSPLLLFLLGWSSGNKFSSISAQRSAVMLVSLEIPMLLVIVAVALASNSLSFAAVVAAQSHYWNIILMPIGFAVFFILMLAEMERPPFDLKEADSELIAGWLTDVSAPYYGLSLLLDYSRLLAGTLLISILFLGGWSGPILPPFAWIMIKVAILTMLIIVIRAAFYRARLDKVVKLGWWYLLPLSVLNLLLTFIFIVR